MLVCSSLNVAVGKCKSDVQCMDCAMWGAQWSNVAVEKCKNDGWCMDCAMWGAPWSSNGSVIG